MAGYNYSEYKGAASIKWTRLRYDYGMIRLATEIHIMLILEAS